MTQKQSILEAIEQLPDGAEYDDAIRAIQTLQRIELGETAADQGKVRAHNEVRALIRTWITAA